MMRRFLIKLSITACLVCAGLVACGDDGSSSASGGGESNTAIEESSSSDASEIVSVEAVVTDTFEVFAFGTLKIDISADSLLSKFDYGDFVTVMVPGYDTVDVPVVENISDVFAGEFLLRASRGLNYVTVDIHYGQAGEFFGIERGAEFPIDVIVRMKKKGGYLNHLKLLESLAMSFSVSAYPDLSAEEYANFRMVSTTGVRNGVLYRSSSPIDPSIGRNRYADSLAEVAGIETFVNLTDCREYAEAYDGYDESYYATKNALFLEITPAFVNSQFKEWFVFGLRYMIEHDGPYLVHCTYGMDRTGYTIAVIEALMGASAEEIREDYVTTHRNYFKVVGGKHVSLNQEESDVITEIIERLMRIAYEKEGVDISDFDNVDLAAATEKYLLALGMTKDEIEVLKWRLR